MKNNAGFSIFCLNLSGEKHIEITNCRLNENESGGC